MSGHISPFDVLHLVISNLNVDNFSCSNCCKNEYFVIEGDAGPRWIVPNNSNLALKVLDEWTPYGISSKIKWSALRFLFKINALNAFSHVEKIRLTDRSFNSPFDNLGLNDERILKEVLPVIYLGTPGSRRKAVVTLIDVNSKEVFAVLKMPLSTFGGESIAREANALTLLKKYAVNGVPTLLNLNIASSCSLQSYQHGKSSSRSITLKHIQWLLALPKLTIETTFTDQKLKFHRLRKVNQADLNISDLIAIDMAIDKLDCKDTFQLMLCHGDFTPWNIKIDDDGGCQVVDWEDFCETGSPLFDITHFYFIQAHLFQEHQLVLDLIAAFLDKKSIINSYLQENSISSGNAINLVLMYMLTSIFDLQTSAQYRKFLINNISVVMN